MYPTISEVEKIAAVQDPVVRNLRITACYSRLSNAFTDRTGKCANWCTYATWASRQAGQTIRREDLRKKLLEVLNIDRDFQSMLRLLATVVKEGKVGDKIEKIKGTVIAQLVKQAADRSADAVARGNKKVFEEIGWEFARFLETCFNDREYNQSSIDDFCARLRNGDPPGGQQYLQQAFRRYYISFFEKDGKKAAEIRFLANVEIGFHEQTRLQPEIAEALNSANIDPDTLADTVSHILFPRDSLAATIRSWIRRIAGTPDLIKLHSRRLADVTGRIIRTKLTENLMTLTFPPGKILLLARDITSDYPALLQELQQSDVTTFLARFDPTTNSLQETGATDWSDLPERLHYISDLFRCYHEAGQLFDPAFSNEQLVMIESGRVPERFDW